MKKILIIIFFGIIAIQVKGQGFNIPLLTDTVPAAEKQIEVNIMLQGGFGLLGIVNEGDNFNMHQLEKVWDDYFSQYYLYLDKSSGDSTSGERLTIPITEQPPPPAPVFDYSKGVKNGSGELIIFVDTTQTVSMPDYMDVSSNGLVNRQFDLETYLEEEKEFLSKYYKPKEEQVQAFPLFLYNSTDSLFSLDTQEGWIYIIQEAKDEHEQWRPIEFWDYFTICGNSLKSIELLPRQISVSKIYKYQGGYKTKLRVKLMTNGLIFYSNEFHGTINLAQLELPQKLKTEPNNKRNARFFKK